MVGAGFREILQILQNSSDFPPRPLQPLTYPLGLLRDPKMARIPWGIGNGPIVNMQHSSTNTAFLEEYCMVRVFLNVERAVFLRRTLHVPRFLQNNVERAVFLEECSVFTFKKNVEHSFYPPARMLFIFSFPWKFGRFSVDFGGAHGGPPTAVPTACPLRHGGRPPHGILSIWGFDECRLPADHKGKLVRHAVPLEDYCTCHLFAAVLGSTCN